MAKKRRIKNPVARNMEEFNRPATHKDKTKYNRKSIKKVLKDLFDYVLILLLAVLLSMYVQSLNTSQQFYQQDQTQQES